MIPVGISIISSIEISNAIGANKVCLARFWSKIGVSIAIFWAVVILSGLNLGKNPILRQFSSDEAVLAQVDKVWTLVMLYILFDILQGMFMGVIRGLGIQPKASFVALTGYWIFGIPIAIFLVAHQDMGLYGIYIGMAVAITFNFVLYGLIIWITDWQKQSNIAQERKKKDLKKMDEATLAKNSPDKNGTSINDDPQQ